MKILFVLLPILIFPMKAFALFEIGGNFAYSKSIFGTQRQSNLRSRTYAGNFTWFPFLTTGIELTYSFNDDIFTDDSTVDLGSGVSITSTQNRVRTETFGIGIKQILAKSQKSFIVPFLSLGYAKQFKNSETDYTVSGGGAFTIVTLQNERSRVDSVQGIFQLKMNLTNTFNLTGSIRTVFKAFEWSKAKDNLKYLAGFSYFF